jgi:dephospho-CoA kinase
MVLGKKAYRVAVTGGAASGKSLVCRYFEGLGVPVINLDRLARRAVLPGSVALERIAAYFGPGVLDDSGSLDRRKIRDRIIRDAPARQALERIVHPEVLRLMEKRVEAAEAGGNQLVVVEVPLLFEAGLESLFDAVILVTADRETRIERLVARDRVARKAAEGLLDAQMAESAKIEQSDYTVQNDRSRENVGPAVEQLFARLIEKMGRESETA